MRNRTLKRQIALALASTLLAGNLVSFNVWAQGTPVSTKAVVKDLADKLIITEIHANDIKRTELGIGDNEVMEFVELYNNSNEDINFNEYYSMVYEYTTGKKALKVSSSVEGQDAVIPAKTAAVLWVRRTDSEAMKNLTTEQFREAYNLSEDTVVLFMSGQNGLNNSDRAFELQDKTGNILWRYAYKGSDLADGKSVELQIPEEGTSLNVYKKQVVPTPGVIEDEQVQRTEIVDAPSILITELCPHPLGDYRKGSGNQYEFIEIYNNSNEILNLKDHTLFYLYPNETKPKKWTIKEDTAIDPYSTAVIWFSKEAIADGYTTTADFNTHYNTVLKDEDIVFYDNSGSGDFNLPNATNRGFAISSSTDINDTIVEAWYNSTNTSSPDSMLNEIRNSSISYVYPTDGSKTMVRKDTRAYSDPGVLSKDQIPTIEGIDNIAPSIVHDQDSYNIKINDDYVITLESDELLKDAKVIYGVESGKNISYDNEIDLKLVKNEGKKYIYEGKFNISSSNFYRYIILAKDESNNERRLPYNSRGYTLTANDENSEGSEPVKYNYGLSLEDGDVISNISEVYATGNSSSDNISIKINGETVESTKSLGGKAIFGFQGGGIDQIYKTSISGKIKNDDFEYFARVKPKYVEGAWYNYEVEPRYLLNQSEITIHSGNENVPYDLNVHDKYFGVTNFDDFEVLNIHLVLPSGKLVKPLTTTTYAGSKAVKESIYFENLKYSLGDGDAPTNPNLNKPLMIDFDFDIPESEYIGQYVNLDTSIYKDGKYTVEMIENGVVVDKAEIVIDNEYPIIGDILVNEEVLEEGQLLRGTYKLDAKVNDETSGLESLVARIDGNIVELPHSLKTSKLSVGNHTLTIEVKDKAGNTSIKNISFRTENESADKPQEVGPNGTNGDVKDEALLSAIVKDPFNENMDVTFKVGDKYDFRRDEITGFEAVTGKEEATFTEDDIKALKDEDDKYLLTQSNTGAPYQRFEVDVTTDNSTFDEVELYWKGNTEAGKNINMYAFNYTKGDWEVIASGKGNESSDITLKSIVKKADFVKDNKAEVKVQVNGKINIEGDYTPYGSMLETEEDDDFSLMWLTDTQYYAESYPEIFDIVSEWTVNEYNKGLFDYVIHTGDIVNKADDIGQWEIADYNMKKLDDANVPYGVLAGNHDSIINGIDYSNYKKYFGENRYINKSWYGGSMDDNRNHYDLVSFNGYDFVVLYIGFGTETEEETINWANEVLSKYSDRNAIIGMHAYLETNATRSEMSQTIFDKVVSPNENVKMVLSGHYHGAALNVEEVTNEDGSTREVIEVLTDYQAGAEGGEGYLRLINFDPEGGSVNFSTYSPYTGKDEYFGTDIDNFTLNIDLIGTEKSISTDYISANVYTNIEIGNVKGVKSGDRAEALWSGLKPNSKYFWYMDILNEKEVETRTDIYEFVTCDFQEIIKTDLELAVGEAKKVTEADLDKVVPAVEQEFRVALAEAEALLSNSKATQAEVNASFERLSSVMQLLEFKKGDKSSLIALVERIKGLDSSLYIATTWENLSQVLASANAVIANENAMEAEVAESYNSLMKAFLQLRLKPNKDILEELIKKAESLDSSKYTVETWKVLVRALDEAKRVLSDENSTEIDVQNAENNLRVAMDELKEIASTETPDLEDNNNNDNNGGNNSNGNNNSNNNNNIDNNNGNNSNNEMLPQTGKASSLLVLTLGALTIIVGVIVSKKKKA